MNNIAILKTAQYMNDCVGFTNISSSCSPIKVSDMLDRLYMTLDSLSTKHGLFKVETIVSLTRESFRCFVSAFEVLCSPYCYISLGRCLHGSV